MPAGKAVVSMDKKSLIKWFKDYFESREGKVKMKYGRLNFTTEGYLALTPRGFPKRGNLSFKEIPGGCEVKWEIGADVGNVDGCAVVALFVAGLLIYPPVAIVGTILLAFLFYSHFVSSKKFMLELLEKLKKE